MTRQTSIQLTEATERQANALRARGFGTFTDVVRISIDRMYNQGIGGKEMIQIGDWVRVQPHTKFVSLSGGAVIDPPKEVRHNGYQRVRVVQVLNDGPGTETVVVEVGGQVDYIPLAYVEKTCTD